MLRKTRLIAGVALVGTLLFGAMLATSVNAQTSPTPGGPGASYCPSFGMMGGFGPGVAANTASYGAVHEAIANALGITNQELWDARAAGKTVAELAAERNVSLETVVAAAAAVQAAPLDAAVKAGTLTQAQADALKQLTRSRLQAQLQTGAGFGGFYPGPGMMGGRGMMGGYGFGQGSRVGP